MVLQQVATRGLSEEEKFEHRLIALDRVTRVVAGGRRFRFRAAVVSGDKQGRVGFAVAKGVDVSAAVQKAQGAAARAATPIPLLAGSIPHDVQAHEVSTTVILRRAPEGRGIIAGGAVRPVLEVAGVRNCVAKILGSRNPINTARATMKALQSLRAAAPAARTAVREGKRSKAK
jgi:small subunit ribosomal protein S5